MKCDYCQQNLLQFYLYNNTVKKYEMYWGCNCEETKRLEFEFKESSSESSIEDMRELDLWC